MTIGVDIREATRKQRAGKGQYVYELIPRLIGESRDKFILFSDSELPSEWSFDDRVKAMVIKLPPSLWQLAVFLYLEFIRPVDVYFSTTSLIVPALLRSLPSVVTLFDFVSYLFPDQHQARATRFERLWMRPAIRHARRLIAISEHTKQDAMRLFGAKEAKITVTPLASDPNLSPGSTTDKPAAGNKILFIGTLEPRKNLARLVEAFNRLRKSGLSTHLILAGQWGWRSEGIKSAISNSPYREHIEVVGYVSPKTKQLLMANADIFAFPSLYEGFGLPPLEAMAMGVPVVTSNASSLPEVVGDAALKVDPKSIDDIYQALRRLIEDSSLREELSHKGREQAEKFSWEKTASLTRSALQDAV